MRFGAGSGGPIAPGVHVIGRTRWGITNGGYSRVYVFEQGEELTVVDSGWDDDAHMILHYLAGIGRSPRQIKHIVLTHSHRSHLGGVAALKEISGAKVYAHAAEAPIIAGTKSADPIKLWPPFPLRLYPFRILSWFPKFGISFLNHKKCDVDHCVTEGAKIGPLTVMHTPGHTDGHLSLRFGKSVIAVGDAVATWPKFAAGWPGFNRDDAQYRESLKRIVALEPQIVGPGHGDALIADTANRLKTLVQGSKFREPKQTE
jgi:glyoxylase-like metal-dependent hydrolase (beta-lactamase superfamily II)